VRVQVVVEASRMPPLLRKEPAREGDSMNKAIVLLLTATSFPLAAQWLDHPDPRIPRTKDGKPNLTAPAPRVNGKPDLSGLW